ncbi:hypothetical protein SALB_00658 [Streptomyces noursei]|uniref:Uncharacterized protein n=1 Tax=Streptomyces noursei TaxID=1971 RepID=A0A401QRD9_STRNR|nr:hypothetical protein SALB_00658 [Streptomyces noursei]
MSTESDICRPCRGASLAGAGSNCAVEHRVQHAARHGGAVTTSAPRSLPVSHHAPTVVAANAYATTRTGTV